MSRVKRRKRPPKIVLIGVLLALSGCAGGNYKAYLSDQCVRQGYAVGSDLHKGCMASYLIKQ